MAAIRLPFFTLLLVISFASVNAVLFTPALPDITHFFSISEDTAQRAVSSFLIGYSLGQLIYGPLTNRFGKKPILYAGVSLQILSCLLCVLSGFIHLYTLLVVARFILALGSGVGLSITFALVNESYESHVANEKISYLMLAFAVTPGLAVALGGFLNAHWGWMSCFYASALYGSYLFLLVLKLPIPPQVLNPHALQLSHLMQGYHAQFKNKRLILGGLLMGSSTGFIYVFSALAPFIAINMLHMQSDTYGFSNCIPPIGLILGSITSARLSKRYSFVILIQMGIVVSTMGVILMGLLLHYFADTALLFLFFPMIVIYFGVSFTLANASTQALSGVTDKANGSAIMSFANMSFATLVVFSLSLFAITPQLLFMIYLALCVILQSLLFMLKR